MKNKLFCRILLGKKRQNTVVSHLFSKSVTNPHERIFNRKKHSLTGLNCRSVRDKNKMKSSLLRLMTTL